MFQRVSAEEVHAATGEHVIWGKWDVVHIVPLGGSYLEGEMVDEFVKQKGLFWECGTWGFYLLRKKGVMRRPKPPVRTFPPL